MCIRDSTTAEAQVYLPVADTNSAMAKYVAQDLQQAVTSGDKIYETDAYICLLYTSRCV